MILLFLLHLTATLSMTGIIWFVQIVHYPLFTRVGEEGFSAFEQRHRQKTFWVVAPLMLSELATGLWLLWDRPDFLGFEWALVGAALIGVNWASTFFVQVPLHGRLDRGYELSTIKSLVKTSWIRTMAWSARAILLLVVLWKGLR